LVNLRTPCQTGKTAQHSKDEKEYICGMTGSSILYSNITVICLAGKESHKNPQRHYWLFRLRSEPVKYKA
jgi:hypothetical protein